MKTAMWLIVCGFAFLLAQTEIRNLDGLWSFIGCFFIASGLVAGFAQAYLND